MAIEGNVGLAFGLVIAAGACTCLGALLVFCASHTNTRLLSAALGASAGVMTYVSMVEIFTGKAVGAFEETGVTTAVATRYATFSFFFGMLLTWALDKLVHALSDIPQAIQRIKERRARQLRKQEDRQTNISAIETTTAAASAAAAPHLTSCTEAPMPMTAADKDALGHPVTSTNLASATPAADPETGLQHTSTSDLELVVTDTASNGSPPAPPSSQGDCDLTTGGGCGGCSRHPPITLPKGADPQVAAMLAADHDHAALGRMGVLAALAVGLHNLPEGLATFVAALASPSAGIAIAIAIALHNIPEGIVVAMPIYYATGSRWKGFAWSTVSAIAEPIGGLLGYTILAGNGMHPLVYGIMFGVVAGMMVYISIRELLPTALRYDPEDRYATLAFIGGCAVMAASLLLFAAA